VGRFKIFHLGLKVIINWMVVKKANSIRHKIINTLSFK